MAGDPIATKVDRHDYHCGVAYRIQLRRDTAANWAASNPVLSTGELALDLTNRIGKVGDGSSTWSSLATFIGTTGLQAIYGTGADGDVTVTGTVTLTRDMNYRNLTMSAASILNTGGFRVFVSGVLTGTGSILNTGGAGAASATAGTAATAGWYGGGTTGGAGGTAAGNAGTAHTAGRGVGSTGGAGGTGSGGAAGAAGTISAVTAATWGAAPPNIATGTSPLSLFLGRVHSTTIAPIQGGTGGGGGGGDGTAGGGGGGGGGVCVVFSRDASGFTGTVGAQGGNGGSPTAGNRGGGGGGGGGLAALVTSTSTSATVNANGGTGGTGFGTGTAGTAGTVGVAMLVTV